MRCLSFSTLLCIFVLINIQISTLSVLFLLHSLTFTSLYLRKTYANVSINYTLLVLFGKKLPILLHHSLFLHLHNPLFSSPLPLSSSYYLNLPAISVLHLDLSLFLFFSGLFAPSSLQFNIISFTLLLHLFFYSASNSPSHIFCFLFIFSTFQFSQSVLLLPSVCFIPNKLDGGLSLRTVLVCHHLCAYLYFSLGGTRPNQSVFRCYLSVFLS